MKNVHLVRHEAKQLAAAINPGARRQVDDEPEQKQAVAHQEASQQDFGESVEQVVRIFQFCHGCASSSASDRASKLSSHTTRSWVERATWMPVNARPFGAQVLAASRVPAARAQEA